MRFSRCVIKVKVAAWTARQRANAARKVKAEADAMPMFPELWRFRSVEERLSQLERSQEAWARQFRDFQATQWRRARSILRDHPERSEVLRHWGVCPAEPHYLLDILGHWKISSGSSVVSRGCS